MDGAVLGRRCGARSVSLFFSRSIATQRPQQRIDPPQDAGENPSSAPPQEGSFTAKVHGDAPPIDRAAKITLGELSFKPGIADKPIASPAVARFRRAAISPEAQELLEIIDNTEMEEVRRSKLDEYYGGLTTDIVVDVLSHAREVDATVEFFEWCHGRSGYTHTAFAFNRLLEFLVNKRQYRRAHRMLVEQTKPGSFQANSFTYSTIVRGYCEDGETKQALALLDHMSKSGVPGNPKLYNIVLTHLCKSGKEKEALELLHQMAAGCVPDEMPGDIPERSDVYEHSKAAYLVELGKGKLGLREMMEKGFKPNLVTFNVVFDALSKDGDGDEAKMMIQELKQQHSSSIPK